MRLWTLFASHILIPSDKDNSSRLVLALSFFLSFLLFLFCSVSIQVKRRPTGGVGPDAFFP